MALAGKWRLHYGEFALQKYDLGPEQNQDPEKNYNVYSIIQSSNPTTACSGKQKRALGITV